MSRPLPTLVPPDDAVLVERAQKGDDKAFTQLYHRHARYLAGVVYRLMGDDHELDDVLQETFLAASGNLDQLRERARFRAWIARTAVHNVYRRLAKRRRFRWLGSAMQASTPAASDPQAGEEVRALFEALGQLPPDVRIPWVLHRVEGHTLPDVAELCDVSLATVKRRIADAEERLDRRLGHAR